MAGRLARTGATVVMVEAGPPSPLPSALRHGDIEMGGPDRLPDWYWPSVGVRTPGLGTRNRYLLGRGLGGGSAVNGMVLSAGTTDDYRRWVPWLERYGHGSSITPWLSRVLSMVSPERPGPDPVSRHFDEVVGRRWGFAGGPDSAELDAMGVLSVAVARRRGRRFTAADAYLSDATAPVQVLTDSPVRTITHRRGRVTGVEMADGRRLGANRVVVAAGSIHSPALLMRSGLMPGTAGTAVDHMRRDGLDHPCFALSFDWPQRESGPSGPHRLGAEVRRLARGRIEPDSTAQRPTARSGGDVTLMLLGPFTGPSGPTGLILAMTRPRGAPVSVTISSDGAAEIKRPDPTAVGGRSFEAWLIREVAALTQELASATSGELDSVRCGVYLGTDGIPASRIDAMTDAELLDWWVANPGPVYHLAATLNPSLGELAAGELPDGDLPHEDLPDGDLLRGELPAGLVVADTSTIPGLVGGGSQLAAMAWAELLSQHVSP